MIKYRKHNFLNTERAIYLAFIDVAIDYVMAAENMKREAEDIIKIWDSIDMMGASMFNLGKGDSLVSAARTIALNYNVMPIFRSNAVDNAREEK